MLELNFVKSRHPISCQAEYEQAQGRAIHVGGCIYHFQDRVTGSPFSSFVPSVRVDQIPAAVAYLKRQANNPSYLVFSTHRYGVSGREDYEAINLQYAIENHVLGLEWVLLGHRNISDRKRVEQYLKREGQTVCLRQMNDVSYLRVENGDLADLGQRLLTTLYGVRPDTELGLFMRWITWSPEWKCIN